jgi:hypothetical protein
MSRTSEYSPFIEGSPTTTTASARASVARAREVALLDVDRAGLGLALDVGLDVGDHHVAQPLQRVQGDLQRPRPDRHPVPGPAQPEQQAVAAGRHVEGLVPQVVATGTPVRWASTTSCRPGTTTRESCSIAWSAVRARSASSTRRRTGSAPSAPGRPASASPPSPWARPWARAIAAVDAPVPPGPVTAIRRPGAAAGRLGATPVLDDLRRPPAGRGRPGSPAARPGRTPRTGPRRPRAPPVAVAPGVDDQDGAAPLRGLRDEVAVERRQVAVDQQRREGTGGGQPGPQLLAETQRTNSAGITAEVAHCPTRRNQSARGRASPSRT